MTNRRGGFISESNEFLVDTCHMNRAHLHDNSFGNVITPNVHTSEFGSSNSGTTRARITLVFQHVFIFSPQNTQKCNDKDIHHRSDRIVAASQLSWK